MYTGANIVRDGLVLALDAANTKSYPGSGTVWSDLSGTTVTGSLINGPTFNSENNGSIVFDGTNDYVFSAVNCSKTNYSIDWWIYPLTTTNYNQFITFNAILSSGWGNFACHTTTNGEVYVGTSVASRIIPWRTNVFIINTWQNFTWTFANGAASFYKNAALETTASLALSTAPSFTSLYIGGNSTGTVNGRISNVKVYSNKVLSASEVLQNYNAVKARFGL